MMNGVRAKGKTVGVKEVKLKDVETGEIIDGVQIYKQVDSDDFVKMHTYMLLEMLGILRSKQADVVYFLLDNVEFSKNLVIGTYDEIAEKTGISRATVAKTMALLAEHGLIAKVRNGLYQISPALLYKGDSRRRAYIVDYYMQNCDSRPDKDYIEKALGDKGGRR